MFLRKGGVAVPVGGITAMILDTQHSLGPVELSGR